ncbi:MAG: prepilin-type N-terminal cleavage/methylation domain-containing protein [Planctomycetota bacterium]|jgi:prepilin-type N-terminal cleavage/methylation domain-containing protein
MQVNKRAGFTLVEMTIAVSILGVALTSAAMVSKTGGDAHQTNAAVQSLENSLSQSISRIAGELALSGMDHLDPDPIEGLPYQDLDYQVVVGYTDTAPDLSVTRQIVAEAEAGDANDGIDNDGDGLIDERTLLMVRDVGLATERRVVLCNGVLEYLEGETFDGADENGNGLEDEPGFHLERNGDVITIRLSVGKQGPGGVTLVRTAELDVRLRN